MSETVLHLQKVAGISGSEAHLLSLLPRLRERGWDVRLLMLHEHEPGALGLCARARARAACRSTRSRSRRRRPARVRRGSSRTSRARGPTILHTHLVHADAYGQLAGALAGVPVRISTKHGFNEFREARASRSPIARSPSSRTCTSRSRAGSRATSRRPRASTRRRFEIVHYGIAAGRRAAAVPGRARACSASAA